MIHASYIYTDCSFSVHAAIQYLRKSAKTFLRENPLTRTWTLKVCRSDILVWTVVICLYIYIGCYGKDTNVHFASLIKS